MNIAPVHGDGPTPDQEELSKSGGSASRGWLHGFWDCFSDPATCCFSMSLSPLFFFPRDYFPTAISRAPLAMGLFSNHSIRLVALLLLY